MAGQIVLEMRMEWIAEHARCMLKYLDFLLPAQVTRDARDMVLRAQERTKMMLAMCVEDVKQKGGDSDVLSKKRAKDTK